MKNFVTCISKIFHHLLFFIPFMLLSQSSFGQISVRFKITNEKNEPVPFASVGIIKKNNTAAIQKKAADSLGLVKFSLQKNIRYNVQISSANYLPFEKTITISSGQTFFSFVLQSSSKTMQGVVIRAKAPLMRQEEDKIIVDPEPIAAASTNAYEILEKTPGIFVDQDGNVYISSLTPAIVYINGREIKMSAADIATMLKNLPPNSISKIEILRTPSAKYDASGSGGIVNIVLKKGVKLGMTGSITAGAQQGFYGNQFLSFNLNNSDEKKTFYINLNYSKHNNYEEIKTDRLFAPDSILSQDAFTKYPSNSYYGALGSSWELGKKWELTYDGSISYNDFNNHSENRNSIQKISTSQAITDNLNTVKNGGSDLVVGNGFETKLKIDSVGSEWSNDTWYSYAANKSNQVFSTAYYMPVIPGFGGNGFTNTYRNYFNAKSDLKLKMKKRFTFEAGLQASLHTYHNGAIYFQTSGNVQTKDEDRTNTFQYNENINAAYIQGTKTLGKNIIIKIGTRAENTNMDGRQTVPTDTSFTIHRTDLFPYIFLSKKVMTIAGYELRSYLVYRRTITRPVYDQLNPFPRYIDQYLSEIGNPTLRPQFTTNYEANISVNEKPLLAIGYNNTKDIFTNVIYQSDTSSRVSYRTYDNLGTNKEFYLRGLGAIPPGGRYFFVLGAQYNRSFYEGLYENKPLSFKKRTWTIFTYHQFKLDKRSQITLNGFVRFGGLQQFYELGTFGALNASLNRHFLKQKLVITLSANDIFYTNQNDFTINQGSINASGNRKADTHRFGINARYNFGIRKKEEKIDIFNIGIPEKNSSQRL
jgi:hypothetical protein